MLWAFGVCIECGFHGKRTNLSKQEQICPNKGIIYKSFFFSPTPKKKTPLSLLSSTT